VFGPRTEVVEALQASQNNGNGNGNHGSKAGHDTLAPEQILSVGSTDWSPEQAELYIDWRLQNLDGEIARLRGQLDDLTAMRKRWLAVTGGRSKMNGSSNGNGNVNGGANGLL
jgi:hypothetical protein